MPDSSRRRALRTYLAHIQRWLWFLALATIIGAVVAYAVARMQPTTYLATTLLQVDSLTTTQDPYSTELANAQLATTYVTLATQSDVLTQAASQVSGVSAAKLAGEVHVAALSGTQLLQIQVEDGKPDRAAALANALAAALIAKHQVTVQAAFTQTQQQITGTVTTLNGQITQLTAQIGSLSPSDPNLANLQQQLTTLTTERTSLQSLQSQIAAESLVDANTLNVFQAATPPTSPDHPRPLPYSAAGGALGLVLAILVILGQRFLDRRVRNRQDIADVTGLPTIGLISAMENAPLLKADDTSDFAESYRELRTNLDFVAIARPIKTLLVTGAGPDDGKMQVAANLAISYALDSKRVLLVDADLRHSNLDHLLETQDNASASDPPMHNGPTIKPLNTQQPLADLSNLFVFTAQQNPAYLDEAPGAGQMRAFLKDVFYKDHQLGLVDLIILVGPALLAVADTQVLAAAADATILVADAAQTNEDQLLRASVVLQQVKAQVEGVVLTQVPQPREDVVAAYLTARASQPPTVSIATRSPKIAQLMSTRE